LVDKPGRRKKQKIPWGKIAGVVVVVLLIGAVGWFVYETYIYQPPPIYARIDTSLGPIQVELFPACAPQTVSNFVKLANSGFYDNLAWHRIVPGFVIQTGDPNSKNGLNSTRATWGNGGSNNTVPLEVSRCSWIGNYEGYLGMARRGNQTAGLNTGTSQFFINLSNSSENVGLNGYYTAFGKVISGMGVVQAIGKAPLCQPPSCPSTWPSGEPLPPVFLTDVVILGTSTTTTGSTPTTTT
jgi:cyclophilin family peptidyl-prolyl cis-trans isomerase